MLCISFSSSECSSHPLTALKTLYRPLLPSCWMQFLALALIPSCLPAFLPASSQACCTSAFRLFSSLNAQQLLRGLFIPKKGHISRRHHPPTHPPLQGGTRVPNPPSLLISGSSEHCCWQPPSLKKNTQEYRLQGILDGPVLSQSRDNSEHRASACQGWNKSTAGGPQVSPINPQPEIPNPL